ncbi:MAG: hypothetical protein Q4G66_11340 [bacterium]|nr:hypothetical protein [bacterium]
MKELLLSKLYGYRYFFAQDAVVRVLAIADAAAPIKKAGRVWLSVPDGGPAELCPLHLLLPWASQHGEKSDHLLVLRHEGRILALPMRGAGRTCMAKMEDVQTLPPAFTGLSRQVVPSLLVNGQEVLMQLNLDELVRAMDKVAYLRKKKLLSRRQVKG